MLVVVFTVLSFSLCQAIKVPLRQFRRSPGAAPLLTPIINAVTDDEDVDFKNVMDLVYIADVNIGGTDYPVQLDTGSSDLWVKPLSGSLLGATSTELTYNITYGIGHAYGSIATAPVTFADFTVQSQALLDVTDSNNPILQFGAVGILGLSFTSLSLIDGTVAAAGGNWGHSFLQNAFAQDTSKPNYIAFLLERTTDRSEVHEGSFTIGELEPDLADAISATAHIPTWPASQPKRWSVLLDGYEFADGIKRSLTTNVQGAPSAVALLDTGASYTYAPESLVTSLYGNIPGASFSPTIGMWSVPCDQQVNLAFWIGGRKFDWHPLDVVVPAINDNTTCVGSVVPSPAGAQFDLHAGDSFLRNVYNVFDFGDYDASGAIGDPYVQLLSLVNISAASQEYHAIRGGTAPSYKSSTGTTNSGNTSNVTPPEMMEEQMAINVEKLVGYAPIALVLLALNAVVLVAILVLGICLVRRRKSKKSRNTTGGSIIPLSRTHSYQVVNVDNPDPETPTSAKKYSDDTPARQSSYSGPQVDDGELTAVNDGFQVGSGSTRDSKFDPATSPNFRVSFHPNDIESRASSSGHSARTHSPGATQSQSTDDVSQTILAPPTQNGPTTPPGNRPIPRSQAYLEAMNARKAALGSDGARRNTFHDQIQEEGEPLPAPVRRFAEPDGGRRATFHEHQEGIGAGRSTIYFDAPENPSVSRKAPSLVAGHGRTTSTSSSRSTAKPVPAPSPIASSPLAGGHNSTPPPMRQSSVITPGVGPTGIGYIVSGHGRSASSALTTPSRLGPKPLHIRSASNLAAGGRPPPTTGWKQAEEADLTEQRYPMEALDSLIDLQSPPSLAPPQHRFSSAH